MKIIYASFNSLSVIQEYKVLNKVSYFQRSVEASCWR